MSSNMRDQKMEVQIPSRAFFEIFKTKMKETGNFLDLMKHRADREKAVSEVIEDYRAKSVSIFQEGKSISSYLRVFNAPLREEMTEAMEQRSQVSSGFAADGSPTYLLQDWMDKKGNEGAGLLRLAKKTVKKYEVLVNLVKAERKILYKKIEELDLNLTCQGKYGGSLQNGGRTESSAMKKRRIQFEAEEDRMRCSIEKSFKVYKTLIAEEIESRRNFLKTMSAIREQCGTLEGRRLTVVVEAYNRYISLIESAEPLSPRRELVLHQMRSIASGMIDVQTNMYKQWSRDKTRYYTFELFTDNWTQYGLGIVTNNVPDVLVPANIQVLSESDKTDSSLEERSGPSHEDNQNTPEVDEPCDDVQLTDLSEQSDQDTKYGGQRPKRSMKETPSPHLGKEVNYPGRDQGAIPKVSSSPESRVRGQMTSPDGNEDSPVTIRHKSNRRQVGPNLARRQMQPPPKSSTDGWRATQTPIGNLTLPVKSDDQAKRRMSKQSPVEETKVESAKETCQSKKEYAPHSASKEADKYLQGIALTGTDHPYYTPGDPPDLETIVLPESDPERPERPFQPMINNWMEPEVAPLSPNSSDHNLLSQFLTRTKSKFRKPKKATKSRSPEILDSGPIPFDFGYEDVDEVSTVYNPAFERIPKGGKAPPPTPGPSHPVHMSKTASPSGSDSSDNGSREVHVAKRHGVKTIKMCSLDSYHAKNDDELSFSSGQTVKMIHPANAEGMAYGYTRSSRLKNREYGYFPVSLVLRVLEDRNRSLRRKVSGFFKKH